MDAPWHAFWTYVVFHRKDWWPKVVVGSILVDLPYFISSAFIFLRDGVSMESWILAYEHPFVKPIGFLAHSLLTAALGFAFASIRARRNWHPYLYGWVFHIFTDMLTHVSDAQPILYPISDAIFPGHVSYWERAHYGQEFEIVNLVLASLFVIYFLSTKNSRLFQGYNRSQIALFGLFSLYLLAMGVFAFKIGWIQSKVLILYIISGFLFFLATGYSYKFSREEYR